MSYSLPDLMTGLIAKEGEGARFDPGEAPILRIRGVLHRVEGPPLGPGDVEALLQTVASESDLEQFRISGMVSFRYAVGETTPFQVTAFQQSGRAHLVVERSG